ncbi:hypothetical protein JAAARDRAFT_75422 [Jaapia argillacea MUCL 33604]|uniref:Prolyl 4-hydroxylase alpha subunit Fe(2+) 2OG dioxygenase domain-containing protein n=1 Tax=Jaapia argillacea MUCL 33604 TaxID=933084 RepID=A0A067QDA3_9AGAM|nr:hypothetical protein JAAARDRAFT_75422 [Jaapia argillacea MUCL 33604]
MSSSVENQLKDLAAAIIERPPFRSGTCTLSAEAFNLYYGLDAESRFINLSKATVEQLELLSDACQPATFGVDQQDVLDETYRKAGKMDSSNFATKFSPEAAGLVDLVRSELLEGCEGSKPIIAELYKLNVYGKDSFFKSHKDTPRGERMFGSLVVVFPTDHSGGALLLRHGGKEWTFDSAKEVASCEGPSIGWIALYSDVEYEVTKRRGLRLVMVTPVLPSREASRKEAFVNAFVSSIQAQERLPASRALALAGQEGSQIDPRHIFSYPPFNEDAFKDAFVRSFQAQGLLPAGGSLPLANEETSQIDPNNTVSTLSSNEDAFKSAFVKLLQAREFLPAGGLLGFGLRHQYPINQEDRNTLRNIKSYLKGSDALILRICNQLALASSVQAVYAEYANGEDLVMMDQVPDLKAYQTYDTSVLDELRQMGGKVVRSDRRHGEGFGYVDEEVKWVTDMTAINSFKSAYLAFGNESTIQHVYCDVCLIVHVGPTGNRTTSRNAV